MKIPLAKYDYCGHMRSRFVCPQCGRDFSVMSVLFWRRQFPMRCQQCKSLVMLHVSEREQKVSIACAILLGVILGVLLPWDGANWIPISIFAFYFIIVEWILRLRGTLQLNIDTESKALNSGPACFLRWWWLLILLVVLWDIGFVLKHIRNANNSDVVIQRLNYQAFIPSIIMLFALIILGVVMFCRSQRGTSFSPDESE